MVKKPPSEVIINNRTAEDIGEQQESHRQTLYSDMSSFIKTARLPNPVADKSVTEASASPMIIDNDCVKCDRM